MSVPAHLRFSKGRRCPICSGCASDAPGRGKRCWGFVSADGEWVRCMRDEHAGNLEPDETGGYRHKMHGECNCGTTHGTEPWRPQANIVATYDYRDEKGTLLYQIQRAYTPAGAPKLFLPRRPDGHGGWRSGKGTLEGVRRVPYRLPEILAAPPESPVFVVEGEKDVHSLENLGFVATTNAGGAKNWGSIADTARASLTGRDVIIIGDRDEDGRNYVRAVFSSLVRVAKSVQAFEPRLGKDITDHLEAGGDIEDLDPVLVSVSEAPPEAKDAQEISVLEARITPSVTEWFTEVPPPAKFLAIDTRTGKGAFGERGVCILGGAGGAGKSFTTLSMALAVACHSPWMGCILPERAGRVLIISAEDDTAQIRERLYYTARTLGLAPAPPGSINILDIHDMVPKLDLLTKDARATDQAHELADTVRRLGPFDLMVVDPIGRVAGASIDKDNNAAISLVSVLESVSTAGQGLVWGVHHSSGEARKTGRKDASALRGATGIGDSARMVVFLFAEEIKGVDPQLGKLVELNCAKANHARIWDPIRLRRGEHGELIPLDAYDREVVDSAKAKDDPSVAKERRLEADRRRRDDREIERQQELERVKIQKEESRRAGLMAAVLQTVTAQPGLGPRELRTGVKARANCSSDSADQAIAKSVVQGAIKLVGSGRLSTYFIT